MSKRPLPKLPDLSPKAGAAPLFAPLPALSARESSEYERAIVGLTRCTDELKLLDEAPDGGDPSRRVALQAEIDERSVEFRAICKRLALKLTVATEEVEASMNRAQRRDYEAAKRKKKKAKSPHTAVMRSLNPERL
jgi:hypothetical protein